MTQGNYILINSGLYSELFELGGDSLLAVYSILKSKRNKNGKINCEKGRNIYHTLREQSKLSVTTLRRYMKQLLATGTCYFDNKGNLSFLGGNKLNSKYKNKRVLIELEIDNFTKTKLNCFKVRLLTMERKQKNRIDRRFEQNKLMWREDKGHRLTQQELNFKNSWTELDNTYASNKETYNVKTVLSNLGYSKLKFGETRSKSAGNYWKKKLEKYGIITTKRNFEYITKRTWREYLCLKYSDNTLIYRKGKVYRQLISSFKVESEKIKTTIEKLEYLDFDFCHFLSLQ